MKTLAESTITFAVSPEISKSSIEWFRYIYNKRMGEEALTLSDDLIASLIIADILPEVTKDDVYQSLYDGYCPVATIKLD